MGGGGGAQLERGREGGKKRRLEYRREGGRERGGREGGRAEEGYRIIIIYLLLRTRLTGNYLAIVIKEHNIMI